MLKLSPKYHFLFITLFVFVRVNLYAQFSPIQQEKKTYYDSVYAEAQKTGDTKLLAEAYYLYGKFWAFEKQLARAQRFYLKSLAILEPQGPSYDLGRIYLRLSEIHIGLLNRAESIKYTRKALEIFEEIHSEKGIDIALGSLAGILGAEWGIFDSRGTEKSSQIDSSLYAFYQLEKKATARNNFKLLAPIHIAIGELLEIQGKKEAIRYLESGVKLFKSDSISIASSVSILSLANGYSTFGYPKKALALISKADSDYHEVFFPNTTFEIYLAKAKVAYNLGIGDTNTAYENHKLLFNIEKKLILQDREAALTNLELAYEDEKKTAQISKQEGLIYSQRNIIVASLSFTIVAILIGTMLYKLNKKNKKLYIQNQLLLKEQNHRVKNNLQVLSSLLKLQSRRVVDETAKSQLKESQLRIQTIALLHEQLHKSDSIKDISLTEYLQDLISGILFNFNLESKVKATLKIVDLNLSSEKALYLSLIINELITNSCKYAFSHQKFPEINILLKRETLQGHLHFWDNGSGITVENKNGFGTQLIAMQAEQLDGELSYYNNNGTNFIMNFAL